jgi:hypothetical protein
MESNRLAHQPGAIFGNLKPDGLQHAEGQTYQTQKTSFSDTHRIVGKAELG